MRAYSYIPAFVAFLLAPLSVDTPASAQDIPVYRGPVKLPDFARRDKASANYRTRIADGMRAGPNFAGHYAIIEIGCGTGCRYVKMADVKTGKVHEFPYGGEEYYVLSLKYNARSNRVRASWVSDDKCIKDELVWNGKAFASHRKQTAGGAMACRDL